MRTACLRASRLVFFVVVCAAVTGCGGSNNELQVLDPIPMSDAELAAEHNHSGSNEQ
jgi:hypothetical protein